LRRLADVVEGYAKANKDQKVKEAELKQTCRKVCGESGAAAAYFVTSLYLYRIYLFFLNFISLLSSISSLTSNHPIETI